MRKILVIISITIGLFAGEALAAKYFINGNDLYALMTSSDGCEAAGAIRYVQGAFDIIAISKPNIAVHIPSGITERQVADIVKLYLKKHPEMRHRPASALIMNALSGAFASKK